MDILKDISTISSYRPQNGDLLKLFSLAVEKELNKEEIVRFFPNKNYFRGTYKKLKDRLLDGILHNSFGQLTKIQQQHFQVRKRALESVMLIYTGNKTAGLKIAEETFTTAEKYELVDIVLSLSRELELLYSNIQINKAKRNKYKAKTVAYRRYYDNECQVQSVYADLAFCIQKKEPTEHIPAAIAELHQISKNNEQFRFRLYYYSLQNLYHRYKGDHQSLIQTSKEAIRFFEHQNNPALPYITKWSFYFQVIPYYLSAGRYAEAESNLNRCMNYPEEGSYNWHLTLLLKVVLGFSSRKPSIAVQAYRQAHSIAASFKSVLIDQRWAIIHAYLCLLHKFNVIHFPDEFRLYRFLNISTSNPSIKTSMLVLELLHLFMDDKKKAFMVSAENIENHIQQHLRGPNLHRPKFFLRMLRSLDSADYHPIRVAAHAKKNLEKLKKTNFQVNFSILDQEPLPYDWLWELVMDRLDDKSSKKFS